MDKPVIITQAILYHGDPRDEGAIEVARQRLPEPIIDPTKRYPTVAVNLYPPSDWNIWPLQAVVAFCDDDDTPLAVCPGDVKLGRGQNVQASLHFSEY